MKSFVYILFLSVFIYAELFSQSITPEGQINSWLSVNPSSDFTAQAGLRFIPSFTIEKQTNKIKYDSEISVNTYGILDFDSKGVEPDGNFKPYRIWIRMSTEQFELRAGLQKINFGPATMLRPLMWFDRIDPRDPLQLTDGVYGILGRYYFLNNANIWIWGLYGNENTKGWEFIQGNKKRPEYGGRLQIPALKGEMAISYHNREVDYSKSVFDTTITGLANSNENRLGLDGRWDIGIGLWFESTLLHQDIPKEYLPWQKQINIGLDYTFGIGKGLNVIKEFLYVSATQSAFKFKNNISFSALALRYPVGLLDNITAMVYYDWTNNDWYRFVNWQRQYDKISLYLMVFWNPDEFGIYQNLEDNSLFTGTGLQFMFVYNY
ncbi:MAG: hypothetical protein JSV22_09380 [Bacteroidales bacterium]|nr:MAG: hypothetical protein JSV22_09380 [Bacteroidales bacterium]